MLESESQKQATGYIQRVCDFARTDNDVGRLQGTPQMQALHRALDLIGAVASDAYWVDAYDEDRTLEDAIEILLRLTRLRQAESA